MQPRIEQLPEKKMVGHHLQMSINNDRTMELWRGFMPKKSEVKNMVGRDFYSIQVYSERLDYQNFNPNIQFEKWAAVEVEEFGNHTNDFESLVLKGGMYAVFIHKGTPNDFYKTMKFIYEDWLPNSGYDVDDRPHFEVLGQKYKNNQPDSEEEVWVPVKRIGS